MHYRLLLWGQTLIEKGVWSWLFAPVSLLWQFVVSCKNTLYRKGWRKSERVVSIVVSVGNIIVGGTGKTPFTQALATHFAHRRVAILMRGYGSDEQLLHARKAKVYVGKDRVQLAKRAEQEGMELLLLDDGFQARQLHRDFDVLLLCGKDPLGKGHFLPWGFLRDELSRIQEADFVFSSGIDFSHVITRVVTSGGEEISIQPGEKVSLFSGIANPDSFRKTVESLGVEIVAEWRLADHQPAPIDELRFFVNHCKSIGCKYIATTEKDFVKLPRDLDISLPLISVEIGLRMEGAGVEKWKKLVAAIEEKVDNREPNESGAKNLFTEARRKHPPCSGRSVV